MSCASDVPENNTNRTLNILWSFANLDATYRHRHLIELTQWHEGQGPGLA